MNTDDTPVKPSSRSISLNDAIRFGEALAAEAAKKPIDLVLYCPNCGLQHVDAPMSDAEYTECLHESPWWELGGDKPERWTNPPHRSHLCHGCGCIWRPADVPTNGVAEIKTAGKADTWPVHPDEVHAQPAKQ